MRAWADGCAPSVLGQDIKADGGVQDKLRLVFVRGKGVCLCPIRVSASNRLSRGGKWRLVTRRCVITETALSRCIQRGGEKTRIRSAITAAASAAMVNRF